MALIQALQRHPGYTVLLDRILIDRERYFANLARGLMRQKGEVDQREIDEKRGFWAGAVWALKTFPNLTVRQYERYVEDALKEAEVGK